MGEAPAIDGRDSEELLDLTRELAAFYTEEWTPGPGDAGLAVLELFSEFAEDVVERLDRVPEKHRVSFLDALGFGRDPPQPSKLPLVFRVVDGLEDNVAIPGGTRAVAKAAGDGPERTFEIALGEGFEAVSSNLVRAYSVDPRSDRIAEHREQLAGGNETELFGGTNLQEHVLYVGHSDLFTLKAGSGVRVAIETTAPTRLFSDVSTWEYYGVEHIDGEEREGWHPVALTRAERSGEVVKLRFEFPGETVETAFSGTVPEGTPDEGLPDVTSRWVRCRASAGEASDGPFDVEDFFAVKIRSVRLEAGSVDLVPDDLLYNDVPLPTGDGDEEVYPFGETPRPLDAFYVASEEAFSKRGTTVEIAFVAPAEDTSADDRSPVPRLSWEYWNGTAWERITGLRDGSNGMKKGGTVAFEVPADLEATAVSGRAGRWIRARITGGEYSQVRYRRTADETWEIVTEGEPPRFGGVTIRYDQQRPSSHLLTYNGLEYSGDLLDGEFERIEPFVGPRDGTQALYLGFGGALSDGPVNLLFSMREKAYPEEFHPRVQWEYCPDPERDEWVELAVRDGTESLTESGIVCLVFPGETASFARFGRVLHWIRARVTSEEFAAVRAPTRRGAVIAGRTTMSADPTPPGRFEAVLPTERPAGKPTEAPPVLRGLHLNAGWAYDVRTVEREVLGSSDGSRSQRFTVSTPPVTDERVWVDESASLSEDRRAELERTGPAEVEAVTDAEGVLGEFWVQWQPMADFLASDGDSRHYVLDRLTGTLTFGDGVNGKIPPRGRNNVRIDYGTGGGVEGNVEAGAVTGLSSSIPFVDSVSNPEPGDGGADGESTEQVIERAPKRLRDGGRAVTAADFERVATTASRELARARCVPGLDEAGNHGPGWVTLLIVPNTLTKKPVPSVELTRRVRGAVRERAPAALVDSEPTRLVVRGPGYVEVSVIALLETSGVESVSNLERTAIERVEGFLHPLSGGPQGTGWGFGELPSLSEFYGLLEGIEGVDHVSDLAMRFGGHEADVTVTEGEPNPHVASDTLVCSGTHDIEATGGI